MGSMEQPEQQEQMVHLSRILPLHEVLSILRRHEPMVQDCGHDRYDQLVRALCLHVSQDKYSSIVVQDGSVVHSQELCLYVETEKFSNPMEPHGTVGMI